MVKKEQLYAGKTKDLYATDDPQLIILSYRDDVSALDGQKKGTIAGKGIVNNRVSNFLMHMLSEQSIPAHFVQELSERETLVTKLEMFPLKVIVRNISAGSYVQRSGAAEGTVLAEPVIELRHKNDETGDPLISESRAMELKLVGPNELERIKMLAFRINDVLKAYFATINVDLVDMKLEFGCLMGDFIVLADEISPDTCRLWDKTTHEKLDKERFCEDLGGGAETYNEIMYRIFGEKC